MANDAAQRENLGERIRRRREQLGLSLRDAVRLTGMSTTTWTNAEHGKTEPLGTTLAKFDRALQWPLGTCRAILAGKPVTLDDLDETKPDDTTDLVVHWVQTQPGLEPHVREFMLAVIARTRGLVYVDAHRGPRQPT